MTIGKDKITDFKLMVAFLVEHEWLRILHHEQNQKSFCQLWVGYLDIHVDIYLNILPL